MKIKVAGAPRTDLGRVEEARLRHLDIGHELRAIAALRAEENERLRAVARFHLEAEHLLVCALEPAVEVVAA